MKKCIIPIVTLILCTLLLGTCFAEPDVHGTAIDQDAFLRRIFFVPWKGDDKDRSIVCFDVDQSGRILMGTRSGQECKVYVLDPQGRFIAGYSFYCQGSYAV